MKCLILLSGKNKKKNTYIKMSSADNLPRVISVKVVMQTDAVCIQWTKSRQSD